MKTLKFIFVLLCLSAFISCSQFKQAVNLSTNSKDLVPKFPGVDRPRDIKNSTAEPNVGDEKAVVVTAYSRDNFYVGMEQYNISDLTSVIEKRFADTPAQKGKIYLNASRSADGEVIARALDIIRRTKTEDINLLVEPEARNGANYSILKIKVFPEPSPDDTESPWSNLTILNVQKNGSVSFAKYDKDFSLKLEKPEIKPEEDDAKIEQLIKDKGEKTICIKPTRSTQYSRLVNLIDRAYSAGATTVYVLIDDMVE